MHHHSVYILAALALSSTAALAQQSFRGLGDLAGGEFLSHADGVSADGTTVVGFSASTPLRNEAFRWTRTGGMQGLGYLANDDLSEAHAVNADGSVIVGSSGPEGALRAFRWTAANSIQQIGSLTEGQPALFDARGVSADGSFVVGVGTRSVGGTEDEEDAITWSFGGNPQTIAQLGTQPSVATGVSADGSLITGSYGDNFLSIFGYRVNTAGPTDTIGLFPGSNSSVFPSAISADGETIVGFGFAGMGTTAFRWTPGGGIEDLGFLPNDFTSTAAAVNADGTVIVGNSSGTEARAFIWTESEGMRDLRSLLAQDPAVADDLAGWSLTFATGISADGTTIVGNGFNADGIAEAWIATIDLGGSTEPDACDVADLTTTGATIEGFPGFGEPDGIADLDDLGYFLGAWLTLDAIADLTTTGATIPGFEGFNEPDGTVDLDDLGFYLGFWLEGCS